MCGSTIELQQGLSVDLSTFPLCKRVLLQHMKELLGICMEEDSWKLPTDPIATRPCILYQRRIWQIRTTIVWWRCHSQSPCWFFSRIKNWWEGHSWWNTYIYGRWRERGGRIWLKIQFNCIITCIIIRYSNLCCCFFSVYFLCVSYMRYIWRNFGFCKQTGSNIMLAKYFKITLILITLYAKRLTEKV